MRHSEESERISGVGGGGGGVGGGECTPTFSYIRKLGSFLRFKFLNFNIFGGFQKNEYF